MNQLCKDYCMYQRKYLLSMKFYLRLMKMLLKSCFNVIQDFTFSTMDYATSLFIITLLSVKKKTKSEIEILLFGTWLYSIMQPRLTFRNISSLYCDWYCDWKRPHISRLASLCNQNIHSALYLSIADYLVQTRG